MRATMSKLFVKAAGFVLAAAAVPAVAQTPGVKYPGGKPVEITVMFGAGSAADVRDIHQELALIHRIRVPGRERGDGRERIRHLRCGIRPGTFQLRS